MASFDLHSQDLEQIKQEIKEQVEQADYWNPSAMISRLEIFLSQDFKSFNSYMQARKDDASYIHRGIMEFEPPSMTQEAEYQSNQLQRALHGAYDAQKELQPQIESLLHQLRSTAAARSNQLLQELERSGSEEDVEQIRIKLAAMVEEAVETNRTILENYQNTVLPPIFRSAEALLENAGGVGKMSEGLLSKLQKVGGSLNKFLAPADEIKTVSKRADILVQSVHSLLPRNPN